MSSNVLILFIIIWLDILEFMLIKIFYVSIKIVLCNLWYMYKMKIFVVFFILFVEIFYVCVKCVGYMRCKEEGILICFKVCIFLDVVFF